jgi:hypothetical protein
MFNFMVLVVLAHYQYDYHIIFQKIMHSPSVINIDVSRFPIPNFPLQIMSIFFLKLPMLKTFVSFCHVIQDGNFIVSSKSYISEFSKAI